MINCSKCGAYAAANHRRGCPDAAVEPVSGLSAYIRERWAEIASRIEEGFWTVPEVDSAGYVVTPEMLDVLKAKDGSCLPQNTP